MPPDPAELPDADRRTVLKVLGTGAVLGGATGPVAAQEQKEEEIVFTDFNVTEDLKEETSGLPQLDANRHAAVHINGDYEAEHDVGVGFYGKMVYGTQGTYYNTFTPETSGEHKIETRFGLQGESLIKQFEFLPGSAHGQNYLGIISALAPAGDETLTTLDGEQIPMGGEILDTDEKTIYNLAVPEGSDVLKDSTIEMATLLLEASGSLSGAIASSVVTGLQIAEILTERGVEADEEFGERLDTMLLSADLDEDTEYVVQNNIIAISGVDLYKVEADDIDDIVTDAVNVVQAISGSFVEFYVEGGIKHVTITPS